jgi:hypothetical protein
MRTGIVLIVIGAIGLFLQILSSIGHMRNATLGGFSPGIVWSPIGTIAIILIVVGIIIFVKNKSSE